VSDLPEVRRGDCGHFLLIDVPPVARQQNGQHEQPVYLCEPCRQALARPKVERKDVPPAGEHPGEIGVTFEREAPSDWAELGRKAALAGRDRTLPPELRGDHARSARPRAWFAGYDSAKERP
jgi:hypothetical protein